jgi:hypothetical protein
MYISDVVSSELRAARDLTLNNHRPLCSRANALYICSRPLCSSMLPSAPSLLLLSAPSLLLLSAPSLLLLSAPSLFLLSVPSLLLLRVPSLLLLRAPSLLLLRALLAAHSPSRRRTYSLPLLFVLPLFVSTQDAGPLITQF